MTAPGLKSPEDFRAMLVREKTLRGVAEIAAGLDLVPGPIGAEYRQAVATRRAELMRAGVSE